MVSLHNCGTRPYLDLQIKYMNPYIYSFADLPDDCLNMEELKEKYGHKAALVGFVRTDDIMLQDPWRIMESAEEQIRVLAPGGGFAPAPGCEYPPNHELINAVAISKAAQVYGRYPINGR